MRNLDGEILFMASVTYACGHWKCIPNAGSLRMAVGYKSWVGAVMDCEVCSGQAGRRDLAYGRAPYVTQRTIRRAVTDVAIAPTE